MYWKTLMASKKTSSRPMSLSKNACIVDVETTGLGHDARIVELALVQFTYDPVSYIIESIDQVYTGLSDPGFPIPREATRIHQISSTMVRGKKLDLQLINRTLADCDHVIAHNRSFDRRLLEQEPGIKSPPAGRWRCTCRQIKWKQRHGLPNLKLETVRRFLKISTAKSHQAMGDVEAVLLILCRPALLAELFGDEVSGSIHQIVQPDPWPVLPGRGTYSRSSTRSSTRKRTKKPAKTSARPHAVPGNQGQPTPAPRREQRSPTPVTGPPSDDSGCGCLIFALVILILWWMSR